LRRQALTPAQALLQRLLPALLAVVVLLPAVLAAAGPAGAAELRQVRGATLLQVGDSNRSYGVALACVAVDPQRQAEAAEWLRRQAPRGTRLNLRPVGSRDGVLLARVRLLGERDQPGTDLGMGLLAAGLAAPLADADPLACPPR
jgi:hypothetical protein